MTALGTFFPRRTNNFVPSMKYAADVATSGLGKISIPAPAAASATSILSAQSIATAVTVPPLTTFDPSVSMAKFGRNVQVVASGAATSTVTVNGRDYLGQPVAETFTLNGTTPVLGKKAFYTIDNLVCGLTAGTTVNVGTGNILGLPYKIVDVYSEIVDGIEAGSAGTIVVGSAATQTATSADPRGTYTPAAGNIPNGSRAYTIVGFWDTTQLHGVAQFRA